MFVKFCGFTRQKDIEFLHTLETVNAAGFIFHKQSPRYISPEKAFELGRSLSGTAIKKAGIFTGNDSDEILEIAEKAKLDILQVYDRTVIDAVGKYYPIFFAMRIKNEDDLKDLPDISEDSSFLMDAFHEKEFGGTGKTFDWNLMKNFEFLNRTIVAGGITADNVQNILNYNIYGIDLSSGIEIKPGIKSREKMLEIDRKIKEALNG